MPNFTSSLTVELIDSVSKPALAPTLRGNFSASGLVHGE